MDSEKAVVLTTLQNYFDAISNNPPPLSTARTMVIGEATRVIRPSANDSPAFYTMTQTLDILEDRIRQTPGIAESFIDPRPEIWLHDNLACIFTGSEQSLRGEGMRRGVHIFSLLKDPNAERAEWKIAGVATVARQTTEPLPIIIEDIDSDVARAAMRPVHQLLASLSRQDWEAFSEAFYSDAARACLSRGSWPPLLVDRNLLMERLKSVIATFPPGAVFAEEVHDVEVRICGEIAMVWTPFVVVVDGNVRSRGVNVFQCMNFRDGWKVVGFVDTSRPA